MAGRAVPCLAVAAMLLAVSANWAGAREIVVPAKDGALARALAGVAPGDRLRLAAGRHRGPVRVATPVTIDGGGRAEVVGRGRGSVITVTAPDVRIRGLEISGSGSSGSGRDAGIQLLKSAARGVVEDNRLSGNLVGVDVHGAVDARVTGNVIEGRRGHRINSRGNGIYVWNAPGTIVVGNDIRWGRDGIFVNTSKRNVFRGNRFRDLRFAVHYMYVHDSEVSENVSLGNHLGYAIMFSDRVVIRDNLSDGDRDYGIMLNYANRGRVTGNLVRGTGDRCVFIYNAHKNELSGNRFERCGIGVHFTAGSERNRIVANAFVGNRTQVKYVGSRWLDWGAEGRGNYWSDHTAYDVDGDGVADAVYRPNDALDRLLWRQPAARMLLGSPAVQLIRWSLSRFPGLLPGGVVDRRPLMRPVRPRIPNWRPPA